VKLATEHGEHIHAGVGLALEQHLDVVAIDLEKFDGAGQPTLEELAKALHEFRATGKKVISYGNEMTQARYYLAAQSDEILIRSHVLEPDEARDKRGLEPKGLPAPTERPALPAAQEATVND